MSVYFLSDLHLGAPYFPDSKEAEKRVVAFLDHIKHDAETIYLLGDVLDYWYEYRYVVPRGFVRFFGKLAELTDSGIRVVWLIGNHDIWINDYIPSELGVEVVDGTLTEKIGDKIFFMTHGDGVGKMKPSFRFLRSMFRNKTCQKLFSGIHPRWTVPFAYNWSRHSRSKGEGRGLPDEKILSGLKEFTREYHATHPEIDFFIYGHVHILSREEISQGCEMVVLGEWIHTFSYAIFAENELKLSKWG
ncbi:MAG: UDP-2,3-diacylglucosamine diphosphatase [Bacteroides sp.]|nr:UDP-2,3-diacylglucosamine diphosphatase [Bacteroides sp.]